MCMGRGEINNRMRGEASSAEVVFVTRKRNQTGSEPLIIGKVIKRRRHRLAAILASSGARQIGMGPNIDIHGQMRLA